MLCSYRLLYWFDFREYQRQKIRTFTRSVEKGRWIFVEFSKIIIFLYYIAYEILLTDNEFLSFASSKNEILPKNET